MLVSVPSKAKKHLLRLAKIIHPQLGLRQSDIILASFPKSGNTWMRFLWANMVSLLELNGRQIDFHVLDNDLVANYDAHSYGSLNYNSLPRLVKTHSEFDERCFSRNRMLYVYRHPGDVMVSYFNYEMNRTASQSPDEFQRFIRHHRYGIQAWCSHVRSWINNANAVLSYEELTYDTKSCLKRVFDLLEIETPEDRVIDHAIDRSAFDRLQKIEKRSGRPRNHMFRESHLFMRKGSVGEWRSYFTEADIDFMSRNLEKWGLGGLYGI